MAEARAVRRRPMVLGRLVNDAALDDEAARLGISTGDDTVRDQVTATPAFHGADGQFDRETYTYALEQRRPAPGRVRGPAPPRGPRASCSPTGVQAPATLPETEALTVLGFLGEKRSFDWIRLDAGLLPEPVPAPTDADLAAEHEAHAADRYTRPETRQITYASVTPEAPRRRDRDPRGRAARRLRRRARDLPDPRAPGARPHRLRHRRGGGGGQGAARRRRDRLRRARRRARAEARGHRPGHRRRRPRWRPRRATRSSARAGPGIVGPVATPLGPSLYRINAVLAASATPFEEVRDQLAKDRALERGASGRSTRTPPHIEDLIAGGATLEEIASETVMQLGHVAFNSETTRRHRRRPELPGGRARGRGRHRDRPDRARRRRPRDAARRGDRAAGGDPPRRDPRPRRRRLDRRADRRCAGQARRRLYRRARRPASTSPPSPSGSAAPSRPPAR